MSPSAPTLCEAKPSQRKGSQVLRVTIFRRRGSRYWQARVWIKGKLVRITTRTQNRMAAEDFAVLAWRHFSRGGGHTVKPSGEPAAAQQPIGI
jgi:hypothetical protein